MDCLSNVFFKSRVSLECGGFAALHQCFDGSDVGWVGDEEWEIFHHGLFSEIENTVVLSPELLGHRLSGEFAEFDGVKAEDFHNTGGGLVALLVLVVSKFALLSEEIQVQGRSAFTGVQSDERTESIGISL